MSIHRTRRGAALAAAAALTLSGLAWPQHAQAATEYTPIPQDQMTVVDVNSVEAIGEAPNGAAELVLDGDTATYWHTQWQGTGVAPPHHLVIKISEDPVELGRIRLTPRQSSNGSGRVNEYEVLTASGDCTADAAFESRATDNLGQRVLLKGYQAEGHDFAHPDYGGHYNERAGGLTDLTTLVNEGADFNANFGVHVNATESYSEAHHFSEELLRMPPQKAWGWMNQSYYINGEKDLATGAVLDRFQQFRDEVPENLSRLYLDVYYPYGWEPQRLGQELVKQGWEVSSEWSDRFPGLNLWSHWSQDERYGGSTNKGLNSNVIRFILNDQADTWNPHSVLGNTNLVDFEGWSGQNDFNGFIDNVWQRNLPTKFLQRAPIVKWEPNRVTLRDGTVATSPLTTIPGTTVPTNREITFDGATVYTNGAYLLPWGDGGAERLYHFNGAGGESTWTLTDAWQGQTSLEMFKLTDSGREKVTDVTVTDGKVTLTAEANVAYVLYPTSSVPAPVEPNWARAAASKTRASSPAPSRRTPPPVT